jgi:hypothetical protein
LYSTNAQLFTQQALCVSYHAYSEKTKPYSGKDDRKSLEVYGLEGKGLEMERLPREGVEGLFFS